MYRDRTRTLADRSAGSLAGLYLLLAAGQVTEAQFAALAATSVATHNAQATVLADLALAAALTAALGVPVPPLGLGPDPSDRTRLRGSLGTLLARGRDLALPGADETDRAVAVGRMVRRLGRAEPLDAGRRAYTAGMRQRPEVIGWARVTGPDPCPLCRSLDDGSVLPPEVPMAHHPGCSCVAQPVTAQRRKAVA